MPNPVLHPEVLFRIIVFSLIGEVQVAAFTLGHFMANEGKHIVLNTFYTLKSR